MQSLRASMAQHGADLDAEQARLLAVRAQQGEDEKRLEELAGQLEELAGKWDEIVEDYRAAAADYERASETLTMARRTFTAASEEYEEARERWSEASAAWKVAAVMIVAARLYEAHNLSQQDLGRAAGREIDCADGVSRPTFRRRHNVASGLDVDHIVPHSLGGADHPLNYQLLSAHDNRSLGNAFNLAKCLGVGKLRCTAAVAVSVKCGSYSGGIPK